MYTGLGARPDTARGKSGRKGAFNGTVLALGFTSFFSDISSEMVAAVIPLFLTVQLGFSPAAFGLFQGVYELANASLRLAGGLVADRTRKPKETAALGYGVSTATRAGLVASALGGITPVPFLLADRLGKGLRTAPRDAMISLATPQSAWGTAFGVHRTLDATGALIGPLLAFVLLRAIPGGFDSIFVASFAFGVVGVTIIGTQVRNPTIPYQRPPSRLRTSISEQFRIPGFRRIVLVGAALSVFTVADSLVYLVIWNSSKVESSIGVSGFGMEWFPLLFAGTAVVFLTFATPLGRLADRVGRARVWLAGHAFLLAVYALLWAGSTSTPTIIGILALLGLYYASTDGVLPALAAGVIPAERRSGGLAILATSIALAKMVSATVFGLIWHRYGADSAVLVAAVGLATTVCFALFTALDHPSPHLQDAKTEA